ncbi:hypothetical protein [Dryocola sp. BD586]|uniref:hypothetical protein n=1 Tax=Dryocola sp. BD586 TaxID=3133271 RepID=UPI003F501650
MKLYSFYLSDIGVNVYEKKTLSAIEKHRLKANGFRKMPYETEAENEEQAIDRMLEHFRSNVSSLKEFAGDISISSPIFNLLV